MDFLTVFNFSSQFTSLSLNVTKNRFRNPPTTRILNQFQATTYNSLNQAIDSLVGMASYQATIPASLAASQV